jgi:hypothetical protein
MEGVFEGIGSVTIICDYVDLLDCIDRSIDPKVQAHGERALWTSARVRGSRAWTWVIPLSWRSIRDEDAVDTDALNIGL